MNQTERPAISHHRAPGDCVAMTALVRDLHLQTGHKVVVCTRFPEIFIHNPHVEESLPYAKLPRPRLQLDYIDAIRGRAHVRQHFVSWFYEDYFRHTGVRIQQTNCRPDLHLSEDENHPPIPLGYWLIAPGGKSDIQTKVWPAQYWQEFADLAVAAGQSVVQVGRSDGRHTNPVLRGAKSQVGKTTLRDLFRLVAYADLVVCNLSLCSLVAAAFSTPLVVVAGGRESRDWQSFETSNPRLTPPPASSPVRHLTHYPDKACCPPHGCCRTYLSGNPSVRCGAIVELAGKVKVPQCLADISARQVFEAAQAISE